MATSRTSADDTSSSATARAARDAGTNDKSKLLKTGALLVLIFAGLGWSAYVFFGGREPPVIIVPTSDVDMFRTAASAAIFGNDAEKWVFERVTIAISEDGATVVVSGRVKAVAAVEEIKKRLAEIRPAAPYKVDVKVGG